jgi:hypothetical protein
MLTSLRSILDVGVLWIFVAGCNALLRTGSWRIRGKVARFFGQLVEEVVNAILAAVTPLTSVCMLQTPFIFHRTCQSAVSDDGNRIST